MSIERAYAPLPNPQESWQNNPITADATVSTALINSDLKTSASYLNQAEDTHEASFAYTQSANAPPSSGKSFTNSTSRI